MGPTPRVALASLLLVASALASEPAASPEHLETVDSFGRPLFDECGELRYRSEGSGWLAVHGDGRVEPAPEALSQGSHPNALALRDLGSIELPHCPELGEPPQVRSHSAYTLAANAATYVGSWPDVVAIGDVTGDGRPDVVMTTVSYFDPTNDFHVFVFAQRSDGTLGAPQRYPYGATAGGNGIALTDLDEDGVLDVVVGHGTGVSVLLADGAGGLRSAVIYADQQADTLATMDVDRDGHEDVISLSWNTGGTIFYGTGTGTLTCFEHYDTNALGYNDHEVEDMDGDCIKDLAVTSGEPSVTPNLSIHHHDGISGFRPGPDTYFMGSREMTWGVGLGDVTGDGLNDAVLSRERNSPTNIWIMTQNASGTLDGPATKSSYDIPETVEVADLDADGIEDVAVLHGGWMRIGLYLHDPATGLESEVLYNIPYATHYRPQGLAIGDINSDNCPDVAIADYNQGLVTLLGQGCFALPDADQDTVPDSRDNCPTVDNPHLDDWDCDGVGDHCDNCRHVTNASQSDSDGDGVGDACEGILPPNPDSDGDGVWGSCDNCPLAANPSQLDRDADGVGDDCDACPDDALNDEDGDGICGDVDNCPTDANPMQANQDNDAVGDACDPDRDGDGIDNASDCGPDDPALGPPPDEAHLLHVDEIGGLPGHARLWWLDERVTAGPNAAYDVATGSLADLRLSRGFAQRSCLVRALAAAEYEDVPASECWYLVRLRSDCGLGTYGDSGATPDPRDVLDDQANGPCP